MLQIPVLSTLLAVWSVENIVKVTGKKSGKAVKKTLKATITVKNPSLTVKAANEVAVGATEQIKATVKPAGTKVTYTSSNKEIATVDAKGVVTGVKAGDVTITVKAGKTTKTVKMTVVAALSAKQTKTKEITVTSATPVTKDSKISVKRGSVEIALGEKNGVAIDATTGKTVVLTTAAKLTKGDYTVTIDDKTVDFQAEDEKVESIEFTSDKAVLQKPTSGTTYTTAKVAYKVYNQFKEDVTSSTNGNVNVNGNGATKTAAGEVTFTNANGYRLNDVVAAVVIYQANAQAVTKSGTFTISNEAAIAEITIKDGVYNKKGEAITLDEDYDLSKGAYVLVSAKDQYGNDVTSLKWGNVTDKNAIVQVAGGLTNLKAAATSSEEITVAGVKYAGIKLAKDNASNPIGAGNATLIVISNGTGKTAQGTITVANGVKVDTITINVPSAIYGGEDNELTYSANTDDIKSYEVADINTLYMGANASTAYDKTADVKGVTADGVKVAFSDYTVACDQPIIDSDNKKIKSTNLTNNGSILKDKDTAEVTLVFTMANGTSVEKKVTLSKVAPQVKSVKLKNNKEAFEVSAGTVNYSTLGSLIEAKDQYDVDIATTAAPRVTVTDIKKATGSSIAVTNNGLSTASITGATNGDVATITLTFAGGTTFKAKLVVGA